MKSKFYCLLFVGTWLAMSASLVGVSATPTPAQRPVATTQPTSQSLPSLLARGRVMLANDDPRSLPILHQAAQQALQAPVTNPDHVQALLLWGRASLKFAGREAAIEAFATGLAKVDAPELREAVSPLLVDGLPLSATDATLNSLSTVVSQKAWTTHRFSFSLPNAVLEPNPSSAPSLSSELLLASGGLSVKGVDKNGAPRLWRTPALYDSYTWQQLPPTLKMNRVVYGYARKAPSDPWRQVVRVLYAAPENGPDDRDRAEKVCADFLRITTVFRDALGRRNAYSPDGVTTVWLSRESALWPQPEPGEAWNAGAWLDSAPGDMILFRSGEARPPAEWLRETVHEYSHIAFPPFGGWAAPLEPFGNGQQGEGVLMLWALQSPQSFFAASDVETARKQAEVHVLRYAVPAWQKWLGSDPRTSISGSDAAALQLLRGWTIGIERVYGAAVLRDALSACDGNPEVQRQAALAQARRRNADGIAMADLLTGDSLRTNFPRVVDAAFARDKKLPLWLAGVLRPREGSVPAAPSVTLLANREGLQLPAQQSATGWVYVPRGAKSLLISVPAGTAPLVAGGNWKSSLVSDCMVLSCAGKSGWQKLALKATVDVSVRFAEFR